jgi:hypothetical protein
LSLYLSFLWKFEWDIKICDVKVIHFITEMTKLMNGNLSHKSYRKYKCLLLLFSWFLKRNFFVSSVLYVHRIICFTNVI